MATTGVLGNGPISFFDKSTHGQVSIPLSALIFDGSVLKISPDAKRTDLSDLLTKGLSQWLAYQASQGFIVPAPTAPAAPAMVFKAADPGVTGNDVTVEIVYQPAPATTYTAKVTKTDRYTGLRKDNIESVLGMGVIVGSQPGLVQVSNMASFTGPGNLTASPDPLVAVTATQAALIKLNFSGTNTLELAASRLGPDGKNIIATVTITDAASGTFSLTATWTTPTPITIVTTDPSTWLKAFAPATYVLSVSAPPLPGTLGAPQAGLYVLRGGADAAPAATATATALAAS